MINLDFDEANQVSNENLGIGDDTWAILSDLENLHDTTPFFGAIRGFYVFNKENACQISFWKFISERFDGHST